MPMLDVYVPEGALRRGAEEALLRRLTEILLRWEAFDPADPVMRSVSWAFLHRPAELLVAGDRPELPRYKVVASVPEGQLDASARAGVIADVTEAVLDAEEGRRPREEGRVWVFPTEVPEGHWGGNGQITPLATILERQLEDSAEAQRLASERIAASRAARTRIG